MSVAATNTQIIYFFTNMLWFSVTIRCIGEALTHIRYNTPFSLSPLSLSLFIYFLLFLSLLHFPTLPLVFLTPFFSSFYTLLPSFPFPLSFLYFCLSLFRRRERGRWNDTEKDIERDEMERQKDREKEKQRDGVTERMRERETERWSNRENARQRE